MEKVKEFQQMKADFENRVKAGVPLGKALKKDMVIFKRTFKRLYRAGYSIAEIDRVLPIDRRNLIKWRKEIDDTRSNRRNSEFIIKC